VGFVRKNSGLQPLFFGGEQEKACVPERAVHQIAGMAKALELYDNLEEERVRFLKKKYLEDRLAISFPQSIVNGSKDGFYNMLNVLLPFQRRKQL
jgi:cysteine desulfurase